MIRDFLLDNSANRQHVLDYIDGKRVIDVGGATSFAIGHLDAVFDINPPMDTNAKWFEGNFNLFASWHPLLEHVKIHGKWDFAICTHTLEDISNPQFVCLMLALVAKEGYVAVPSKYTEMKRFSGKQRGFIHHRWIYDIEDGKFTGYPKINYTEQPLFDALQNHPRAEEWAELTFWWKLSIDMEIVNNDFLGPTVEDVEGYYNKLITNPEIML